MEAEAATADRATQQPSASLDDEDARAWRAIRRDNAHKAFILENSHSPVLTFGAAGRLIWANRGFERLTGFTADALCGTSYRTLLRDCEANRLAARQLRRLAVLGKPVFDLEVALRHRNGRLVWLAVDVHPMFDGGELTEFAVLGFDITDRKRDETLKSDFVSLVGHELRTPLTVVSGALEAMAAGMTGITDPASRELIEIGQRNCVRLRRLIENLLDVNRIETGTVVYRLQDLPVGEAVRRVAGVLAIEIDQAGLALDVSAVDPALVVSADPARFEQVLMHLLSNAIKFSPPGRPVRVRAAEAAQGRVRISVVDCGAGVSPEFVPRLFEKFARDAAVLASGIEGFGLGLSIARALVTSMNGRIGYEAGTGDGCEFWFELPAADPRQAENPPGHPK